MMMKPSRSYRPSVDALESRELLSQLGPHVPGALRQLAPIAATSRVPETTIPTPQNPRVDLNAWLGWHAQVLEQVAADGQPSVAFFGDSIMGNWIAQGEAPWKAILEPLGAVDYALPGSTVQNLHWHLENGGLANQPKVAVVQIGINNLGLGDSPREVSQGIAAVLREFRQRSRSTSVIVLALFPPDVPESKLEFRQAVDQANTLIAATARRMGARFLDLNPVLTDSQGKPRDDLYRDEVHLTEAGYSALANALVGPLLEALAQRDLPRRPTTGPAAWPSWSYAPGPRSAGVLLPPPRWLIPVRPPMP